MNSCSKLWEQQDGRGHILDARSNTASLLRRRSLFLFQGEPWSSFVGVRFSTILDAGPKYCFFCREPFLVFRWLDDIRQFVQMSNLMLIYTGNWSMFEPVDFPRCPSGLGSQRSIWVAQLFMSDWPISSSVHLWCSMFGFLFFLPGPIYPIFVSLCRWL